MTNKKKLLIITHNQFGYQISSYKYAQYLKLDHNITYICFDYNRPRFNDENIDIHYVRKIGIRFLQLTRFIYFIAKLIKKGNFDIILLKYFPFCSLLNVFVKKTIVLDIRTASVSKNNIKNKLFDTLLKRESNFFTNVIILSESLKQKLKINTAKVIPLGSDKIGYSNKIFNSIRLLYVGTFNNRHIYKTIEGSRIFINSHNFHDIKYTIIGTGSKKEIKCLTNKIEEMDLSDFVTFRGLIPYDKLKPFFESHNIGVSFIPITEYFQFQPPAKTYEYLFSGMPVIATNTYENNIIINEDNGVLIEDTPIGFAAGLKKIYDNRCLYSSDNISKRVENYSWENIILNGLSPYLQKKL